MFINEQTIDFYKLRTINRDFDGAETDVNHPLRDDLEDWESADLFYSFCGC